MLWFGTIIETRLILETNLYLDIKTFIKIKTHIITLYTDPTVSLPRNKKYVIQQSAYFGVLM